MTTPFIIQARGNGEDAAFAGFQVIENDLSSCWVKFAEFDGTLQHQWDYLDEFILLQGPFHYDAYSSTPNLKMV